MDKLTLKRTKINPLGLGGTSRTFFDFYINGKSLRNLLDTKYIIPLNWLLPEYVKQFKRQLLCVERPELLSGKVPIYICAECGDLGCGAIAAKVSIEGEKVIWSDFVNEWDIHQLDELSEIDYTEYSHIGPFTFELTEYIKVIEEVF